MVICFLSIDSKIPPQTASPPAPPKGALYASTFGRSWSAQADPEGVRKKSGKVRRSSRRGDHRSPAIRRCKPKNREEGAPLRRLRRQLPQRGALYASTFGGGGSAQADPEGVRKKIGKARRSSRRGDHRSPAIRRCKPKNRAIDNRPYAAAKVYLCEQIKTEREMTSRSRDANV